MTLRVEEPSPKIEHQGRDKIGKKAAAAAADVVDLVNNSVEREMMECPVHHLPYL